MNNEVRIPKTPYTAQPKEDPLKEQVGGSHYSTMKLQPVEFIAANKIPFMEGSIIKYACRHGRKKGAEDIRKIIHYARLILKLQYGESE